MIEKITKEYLESLLLLNGNSSKLDEFRKKSEEERIPVITSDVERLVGIILESAGAKKLFEVGTATGYSACFFAETMGEDSFVKTVERDDYRYFQALENIREYGYKERINAVKGDAADVIKQEQGVYDAVFLDGNKGHYIHMLEDCKRILKPGGLLICDNVLFRGMIDKSKPLVRRKITIVKRLRMFLEAISSDSELDTSVLPIGDGLSISIKKTISQ